MFVLYMNTEWNIHTKKSSFHPQLLIALLSKMWNTHITANARRGFLSEEHILGLSKSLQLILAKYQHPFDLFTLRCEHNPKTTFVQNIKWGWAYSLILIFLDKASPVSAQSIGVMQMHRIKAFFVLSIAEKEMWTLSSLTFPVSLSISVIHWTVSVSWWAAVSDNASFLHVSVVWSVLLWEMWNGA